MKATYCGHVGFMNEYARRIFKTYQADILDISEDDEGMMEVTVGVQSRGHANDLSSAFESYGDEVTYHGWY